MMFGRMPEGAHRRQYRRAGIGTNWNQNSDWSGCKCLKTWWPWTELNRLRQPFQGCLINNLQTAPYENTRLTRNKFGLHLDARGFLDSAWTPHSHSPPQPLLDLNLLLRARSKA